MKIARKAVAITPHDSTNMAEPIQRVYVGGTGNVVLVNRDGTTATFVGVPVGTFIPVDAKRVNATGTTATNLVGLVG